MIDTFVARASDDNGGHAWSAVTVPIDPVATSSTPELGGVLTNAGTEIRNLGTQGTLVVTHNADGESFVTSIAADGTTHTVTLPGESSASRAIPGADGSFVIQSTSNATDYLTHVSPDGTPTTVELLGYPSNRTIVNDDNGFTYISDFEQTSDPDGSSTTRSRVVVISPEGALTTIELPEGGSPFQSPYVSDDGTAHYLVYSRTPDSGDTVYKVLTISPDGSPSTAVLSGSPQLGTSGNPSSGILHDANDPGRILVTSRAFDEQTDTTRYYLTVVDDDGTTTLRELPGQPRTVSTNPAGDIAVVTSQWAITESRDVMTLSVYPAAGSSVSTELPGSTSLYGNPPTLVAVADGFLAISRTTDGGQTTTHITKLGDDGASCTAGLPNSNGGFSVLDAAEPTVIVTTVGSGSQPITVIHRIDADTGQVESTPLDSSATYNRFAVTDDGTVVAVSSYQGGAGPRTRITAVNPTSTATYDVDGRISTLTTDGERIIAVTGDPYSNDPIRVHVIDPSGTVSTYLIPGDWPGLTEISDDGVIRILSDTNDDENPADTGYITIISDGTARTEQLPDTFGTYDSTYGFVVTPDGSTVITTGSWSGPVTYLTVIDPDGGVHTLAYQGAPRSGPVLNTDGSVSQHVIVTDQATGTASVKVITVTPPTVSGVGSG